MTTYAVTVLGRDRAGIVAQATGLLADLGVNLEDSSMTLLRGHFAMTLVCAGEVDAASLEAALRPLSADGTLTVAVGEVPDAPPAPTSSAGAATSTSPSAWVLTVHGADRPGIVSVLTRRVAALGANITDLTTRLTGALYVLVAEIDLPADVSADAPADVSADVPAGVPRDQALRTAVAEAAAELGVSATVRPVDPDRL